MARFVSAGELSSVSRGVGVVVSLVRLRAMVLKWGERDSGL